MGEDADGDVEVAADDGVFWMSYADFLKHFVSISVCMAHVPQQAEGVPPKKAKKPQPWTDDREVDAQYHRCF